MNQSKPTEDLKLKKSASKDSLVSNMLLSFTKLIGGTPIEKKVPAPLASDSEDTGNENGYANYFNNN